MEGVEGCVGDCEVTGSDGTSVECLEQAVQVRNMLVDHLFRVGHSDGADILGCVQRWFMSGQVPETGRRYTSLSKEDSVYMQRGAEHFVVKKSRWVFRNVPPC